MAVQLSNQLKLSSSAYLRQHAEQPVHWQMWSKQTLQLAKDLNRPILVSIGYAACHWCHVMAHESFDDYDIANFMNENFINIKIDREERPDLDQIYMAALTAMGEQGGWPLTMFLTPDAEPFWGGTYFPPHARNRQAGFDDILSGIIDLFHHNKNKVVHNSRVITQHIQLRLAQNVSNNIPSHSPHNLHSQYVKRLSSILDPIYGGVQGAPKFPSSPLMEVMWLSFLNNRDQEACDAFMLSLRSMLQGGIYDHIGGGLCRYSVDDHWLVPHFEKMLYDNSQLIKHGSFAYAQTHEQLLRVRIEETIEWLQRELQLPLGGFASSLDADSEGVEGKYYIWQRYEIDDVLGGNSNSFCDAYDVSAEGNWEGSNILNRLHSSVNSPDEKLLEVCKKQLMQKRETRIAPARDDKLLVDWNAQLIVSLINAGRVFGRNDWIELAKVTYATIRNRLDDLRLCHCLSDYRPTVKALSSDYASMINAALSLYGYGGNKTYLSDAQHWLHELNEHHRDTNGDYRLTALDQDDVIIHIHADQDDATPSATAQLIEALSRLSLIDQNIKLQNETEAVSQRALTRIQTLNYGQAGILNASVISKSAMILHIFADSINHPMIKMANQIIDMRRTDVIKIINMTEMSETNIPYIGIQNIGQASAYLCLDNRCLAPVYSADDLEKLLKENAPLQI
ncbi:thioredoxin domain-containing protein [Brucellaceae bacterium C25G]